MKKIVAGLVVAAAGVVLAAEKMPGLVLVSGDGSGAAAQKVWQDKGYAARFVDVAGADAAARDAAVAQALKAVAELRKRADVDAERIGVVGAGRGAEAACLASGKDGNLACTIALFGCVPSVDGDADAKRTLANAGGQFLWLAAADDAAYPLAAYQKNLSALKVPYYRATRPGKPDANALAKPPKEAVEFAEFRLKRDGRTKYPFVRDVECALGEVVVEVDGVSTKIVKAEVFCTADPAAAPGAKWTTVPAAFDQAAACLTAKFPVETRAWFANAYTAEGLALSAETSFRSEADVARDKDAIAKLPPPPPPLPQGVAGVADFTTSPGKVKPFLHCASWVTRSYPRGIINDDDKIRPLHLTAFRTHDAPLVNNGQRIVDTHLMFPLMHLDAKDPKNYVFEPTDHFLKLNFDVGMKCFYRLGTSIEHTGPKWGYNTLNPKDHKQYAEAVAGIVRHYVKGWGDGYRWSDRIPYWEIYNEPDVDPCWRGTKEEFIDLFVTVLKRLKTEFPDIKVGGPAFGGLNLPYMRELLEACLKAGVKPDFLSWHYYGSNLRRFLAMPAKARALCDELGLKDCELVINEWHYVRDNSWDGIQGASSKAALVHALEGPAGVNGIDSAVYTVQVETGFHDTPLAQSYFYGCGYQGCFGYADRYREFNKVWYGMRAMGELVNDCSDRAACRTRDRSTGVFGAWTKDRKAARLLLTSFRGEGRRLTIAVKGVPETAKAKVQVLDDARNLVATDDFDWHGGMFSVTKNPGDSALYVVDFAW